MNARKNFAWPRYLLPLGLLLTLLGYFGPWLNHPAAGLVIIGLDLGEYVKFLPAVRSGDITLWRPGFYAPLVAAGAAAALVAYRRDLVAWPWLRLPHLLITLITALNLMPPAWTPARLLEPEFRWQTSCLLALLMALALSPFLALFPRRLAAGIVTLLAVAALLLPIPAFLRLLPALSDLYARPQSSSWGPWTMAVGLLLLTLSLWWPTRQQAQPEKARQDSRSTFNPATS